MNTFNRGSYPGKWGTRLIFVCRVAGHKISSHYSFAIFAFFWKVDPKVDPVLGRILQKSRRFWRRENLLHTQGFPTVDCLPI